MRHKRITRKFISLINTPLVKYLLILLVFIFSINILGQFNFNLSFSPRKALANETVDVTPCPSGQVHQGQNCDCGCPADPPCTIPGQVKDASCVCGCPTPCPGNKTRTDPAKGCGCSCPTPCTSPQVHGDDDLCICDCPASTAAAETACNNSCPQFHTCNWIDAECRCDEVCSIDASDCPGDNSEPHPSPSVCDCRDKCDPADVAACTCESPWTCDYDYDICKCNRFCNLTNDDCDPDEEVDPIRCDCKDPCGTDGKGEWCICRCLNPKCCEEGTYCCHADYAKCCNDNEQCIEYKGADGFTRAKCCTGDNNENCRY